jgi:hypothetical protein
MEISLIMEGYDVTVLGSFYGHREYPLSSCDMPEDLLHSRFPPTIWRAHYQ